MDYADLKFPKAPPRVVTTKQKRLDDRAAEAAARKAVRARDGWRCAVPGCRERGVQLHHITYRSRSKALRWATGNLVFLCPAHHALEHAGKITISGDANDEITVTGDRIYLTFRL